MMSKIIMLLEGNSFFRILLIGHNSWSAQSDQGTQVQQLRGHRRCNPKISHAVVCVPADGSGCDPEYQCIVYGAAKLH